MPDLVMIIIDQWYLIATITKLDNVVAGFSERRCDAFPPPYLNLGSPQPTQAIMFRWISLDPAHTVLPIVVWYPSTILPPKGAHWEFSTIP